MSTLISRLMILFLGITLSGSVGCRTYKVRVNAFLSHELVFPDVTESPPPSIAVVVGTEPDEPLLEAEVRRKVVRLVKSTGFEIEPEDSADYVLTCWASIDRGVARTEYETYYSQPTFATSYVYGYHGQWIGVGGAGYSYTEPHTSIYYKRFLGLTLYEREKWKAAEDKEIGEAAVWTCTSASIGTSSDLRSLVNYLLAASFDQFGIDTERELRIRYRPDDDRVMEIARMGRKESP